MTLSLNRTFDSHVISTSRGQRQETFRFELIDGVTNEPKGQLHPLKSSTPTLSHDTTRTISRMVSNLSLDPTDTSNVNVVRDRVLISMSVGGDSYPLGRYMFADQARARHTFGLPSTVNLVDEMFIIDQPLDAGFTTTTSTRDAQIAAATFLQRYPITFNIEPSAFTVVGSWAVGTSGARTLNDIALDGSYFTPWFDNNGVLRMIQSFNVLTRIPDIDWDTSNTIIMSSITETDDLINSPNQFVVVAAGGTDITTPVVGTARVPASAPHSVENRGFVVSDVREAQVTGSTQATSVAENLVRRQTIVERTELSTAPDPRHDGHQVIRWQGTNWLEIAWSLALTAGGDMRHVLARRYA